MASMKIFDLDNREMMHITSVTRDGSDLMINGVIFGSLPLSARLRPEEARAAFRMMGFKTIWFLMTLPFRTRQS